MQWAKKQTGFTIVELLIVVVVIAILAAITIVAYNGISNRAKASSAQSAASQAMKKVIAFAIDNSEQYPETLPSIGVTDSEATNFQYKVNNTVSPRTFCITVTSKDVSYFVSNTNPSPQPGGCPGHGQKGVAALTNYVRNPGVEVSATDWGYHTPNGTISAGRVASDGLNSTSVYRVRWTSPTTSSGGGCYPRNIGIGALQPGKEYTSSVYVRPTITQQMRMQIEWQATDGTRVGGVQFGPSFTTPANTWTRVHHTATAPEGVHMVVTPVYGSPTGTTWPTDSYVDCDAAMMTEGSTLYSYADGTSENWDWNGTPQLSSSSGPPL